MSDLKAFLIGDLTNQKTNLILTVSWLLLGIGSFMKAQFGWACFCFAAFGFRLGAARPTEGETK